MPGQEDLSLERATLTALLERYAEQAAWDRLRADGWLDLGADRGGVWSSAPIVALVAEVAARSDSEHGAGAHLAAAATLSELGDDHMASRRLGVVVDVRPVGELLCGRMWAGPAPDAALAVLPDGSLGVVACADLWQEPTPLLALRQGAVRETSFLPSAVIPLETNEAAAARHEARVAWLLAVEALAVVDAATERTIAYTRQREAFGGPLSGLQVVRHKLVDMRTISLMGAALCNRATAEWAEGRRPVTAWAAKALAGSRGVWAAEQSVQLHGGIGFTWELGLHRVIALVQRARLLLGGSGRAGRELRAATMERTIEGLQDWSPRFRARVE